MVRRLVIAVFWLLVLQSAALFGHGLYDAMHTRGETLPDAMEYAARDVLQIERTQARYARDWFTDLALPEQARTARDRFAGLSLPDEVGRGALAGNALSDINGRAVVVGLLGLVAVLIGCAALRGWAHAPARQTRRALRQRFRQIDDANADAAAKAVAFNRLFTSYMKSTKNRREEENR